MGAIRVVAVSFVIAGILISAHSFSSASDPGFRTIPFYNPRDPDQLTPKLQLRVKEKVYPPDAVYTMPEMLKRAENPFDSPENNILGYIGYVLSGKTEEVDRFYFSGKKYTYLGMTPEQLAESARPDYKNTNRVRLLRSWNTGMQYKLLAEFLSENGRVNIFPFSVKRIDAKFYKTYGGVSIVGGLLGYIGANYRTAVHSRFTPVELPYSLTYYYKDYTNDIIVKDNPATLYFTGTAYKFEDGWTPVGEIDSIPGIDRVIKFVHDAMDIATNGTSEEFISLYTGKDKEYMEMALNRYISTEGKKYRNMTFPSFKNSYGARGSDVIRHIFTLDLGKEYVHFYNLKGNHYKSGEDDLQYMMIHEADGKLWLTETASPSGIIPGSIGRLLNDEHFQKKILEIWMKKTALSK